jgi:hypothetical protein
VQPHRAGFKHRSIWDIKLRRFSHIEKVAAIGGVFREFPRSYLLVKILRPVSTRNSRCRPQPWTSQLGGEQTFKDLPMLAAREGLQETEADSRSAPTQ